VSIYHILNILSIFSDNLATFLIKAWPLEADLFDGDLAAGPIASLFSLDPAKTTTAIKDNILKAHWDLNKLAKAFFMPENLNKQDAFAYVKKPR